MNALIRAAGAEARGDHDSAQYLREVAKMKTATKVTCAYCSGGEDAPAAVAIVNLRGMGTVVRMACCEYHRDLLRDDSHYNGEVHIDDA